MTSLSAFDRVVMETLSTHTSGNRCCHWFHSGYVPCGVIGISSKGMAYNPASAGQVPCDMSHRITW
jgi:hypothetical protein